MILSMDGRQAPVLHSLSCKTRKPDRKDIFEIGPLSKTLGGNYCLSLYINAHPIEQSDMLRYHAQSQQTLVIDGYDLPRLVDILFQQIRKPAYFPH